MPGIVGIVTSRPGIDKTEQLQLMLESMVHEDFYKTVQMVDENYGVYAGWVGHPGSFSDCMPAVSRSGEIVMVFAGENFGQSHWSRGRLDADTDRDRNSARHLPELYEQDKDGFFNSLNGWFQGLILDKGERRVLLFNDRFGVKRVYWHQDGGDFLFSSEAKALLRARPHLRNISSRSLGEFFSLGSVLSDRTLFSDISILSGGSRWVFVDGRIKEKGRYFRPSEWENQDPLDEETFNNELQRAFREILPSYCNPDGGVALSLTGGLDTRIILSNYDPAPGKLPTYTFGGMYRDSFDVKVARKVARACGQSHEVLRLGEDFIKHFPDLARETVYLTDGDLDLTGAPELYLNRMAREIAPVRLTGNFGSEVIRGHRTIKPFPPDAGIFNPEFNHHITAAADTLRDHEDCHWLTFIVFKQTPWHHYGRMALEGSQVTLRTPYMDNRVLSLLYQSPEGPDADGRLALRLIAEGNRNLGRIATDRGHRVDGNTVSRLASRIYYESIFKGEYFYDYGMPPWLSRIDRALSKLHLERLFLGWHKFYHYRTWFQNELSPFVRDVLLDRVSRERPYVNGASVEKLVCEHLKGVRNHTVAINKLITVELIHRLFID